MRVGRRRSVHAHFHAVLHLVSEVLMLELVEAAGEHGGTGDQNYRQGGLHDKQSFAGERRTILGTAACAAECFGGIGTRGEPRRSCAEDDAGYER